MTRGDFKLVTHPEKAPAVDFITRSSVGPFVDTGVDVIMRSQPGNPVITERVYLSVATIGHLAQLAGIDGDATITPAREKQLIAQGKLEGLREGLDGQLADLGRTLRRWLDDAGVGGPGSDRDSGL
mgnify:CR=1 FL=1